MLQLAATLEVFDVSEGAYPAVQVKVTNETGHKLPSGYPEVRRVWINVKAYDEGEALIFESGVYDFDTAYLSHDEGVKIYKIKPGASYRLADLVGVEPGPLGDGEGPSSPPRSLFWQAYPRGRFLRIRERGDFPRMTVERVRRVPMMVQTRQRQQKRGKLSL